MSAAARRGRWPLLVGALLVGPAGCYEGRGQGPDEGDGRGGDESAGEGGSGDEAAACEEPTAPAPAFMRRLAHGEYRNTVEDLLGAGLPDASAGFPAEPVVLGYDNNREAISISDVLVERYRDAAEAYAAAVVEDPARRQAVVGCDAAEDGCLASFVRSFGRRAYRRPLADDEVAALVSLGQSAMAADPEPELGTRVVLEAMLQSPSFLYRVELGVPDPEDPAVRVLSGYEVATRLSYLVLASTPTDALLDAAEAGQLDDADGRQAALEALLDDPRAPARLARFYAQWLDLVELPALVRSSEDYPAWSDALRAAMEEEAHHLLQTHLLGGGDLLDVLVDDRAWVDATLAGLYGVAAPGEGFAEVELGAEHERVGLLTTAAILAVTGREGVTTPIRRGKFVREALLCHTMPPPPPDIPRVPAPAEGQSERERLEQHRQDPACGGCHDLLEPLGFGLARYDSIGALRTVDDAGQPISAEGSFDGQEPDFDGAAELSTLLREDPDVSGCVVLQVHRYAYGRGERDADLCAIDELQAEFAASGRSFEALLAALVRSETFVQLSEEG